MIRIQVYLFVWIAFLASCSASSSSSSQGQEKLSEELYVATDFTPEWGFTKGIEGPATDKKGNIYAVNFGEESTIGIVSPEGKSTLFVSLPEGSTGNGIRINSTGDLFIADHTGHNVLRIDPETKAITIHAHNESMNQPNDLAIKKDGTLFASDPIDVQINNFISAENISKPKSPHLPA